MVRLALILLGAGIIPSSPVYADPATNGMPKLEPVVVQGVWDCNELIGPYQQPRWSSRGRFSTGTDAYVIPPYEVVVDVDYQATIPRHGKTVHLYTQEFEIGLPYRFQLAYENNVQTRYGHTQVTSQTAEARYALADWGKIPLNPTLFAEYKFGVGKDYGRQEDPDDPLHTLPDAFEFRLLFSEELCSKVQWVLNIFHEQDLGGDREWETGFSQALTYAVNGEHLKVGVEMQYIYATEHGGRSQSEQEFDIGPSFAWKPTAHSRLDLAALFGTTSDSPSAKIFAIFSYAFGKVEDEGGAPVSTRNR